MKPLSEVTILTLMSGRWYSMEPYLSGITNLDYPKCKINVLWYTNAQDNTFLRFAGEKAVWLKNLGFCSVRLVIDQTVKVSGNTHTEGGLRTIEHAIAIASLYNSAWNMVNKDNPVFFIEDDIVVPSHSIKKLLSDLSSNGAFYVCGVQFDRHKNQMFAWMVDKEPLGYRYTKSPTYVAYPPRETWGLRPIGAGHLGCTLIEPRRIPRSLRKPLFRPQSKINGAKHFIGCDIVLCVEGQIAGGKCLIDYDVRAFHYDSNGIPH